MSLVGRTTVGLSVAAMATICGGVAAVPAAADSAGQAKAVAGAERDVPEALAGKGKDYPCGGGVATSQRPVAALRHRAAPPVRGPMWTSIRDGCSVTSVAQANSLVPDAIPQLLLKPNRGLGLSAKITYIQRLDTAGGGTPTDGVTPAVSYPADYTSWVAVP